jgi:hypothetical protein
MSPTANLQVLLTDHRAAVDAFLAAARGIPPSRWAQPRAPGKWSPAQVTEHVTRAYEVNRGVLHGSWPGRSAPRFLRPVIRTMLLNTVLRRGRFGKGGKSPGPFRPGDAPAAQEPLTARLQAAAERFETELAARVRSGESAVEHPFFGRLRLVDYLRLNEIHTNHHRGQLSGGRD